MLPLRDVTLCWLYWTITRFWFGVRYGALTRIAAAGIERIALAADGLRRVLPNGRGGLGNVIIVEGTASSAGLRRVVVRLCVTGFPSAIIVMVRWLSEAIITWSWDMRAYGYLSTLHMHAFGLGEDTPISGGIDRRGTRKR